MKQKPKHVFGQGLGWYCKWAKSGHAFGCYHRKYSRPCMAAIPNSLPICMKFSMRVVLHEKRTHAKNRPDRTTICKLKNFFFAFVFFTFSLFVFYLEKLISLASGYLTFNDREQKISQTFFAKKS